ncbi:MAG TPA: SCO family protein [Aromatoleum sp.]|uniref:SCO family protein n=1 Tax=Aromatoleum sp. TaxID=2307007 RepID=UPI002B46A6D6|nr:SCO family protein [Aromatoleum sp.]HJV25162.1 SCO family protein [Aromatoleum sp.]
MIKALILLLLNLSIGLAGAFAADLPNDSIYQVKSKWVDQSGKTVELSSLAGKPVAISMIYLSCKFSCPTTVSHMKALQRMLPEHLKNDIQFVLVSFDPTHDTPAAMKKFAGKHSLEFPQWRFITARNESDLRELSSLIEFKYRKIANGDFEHSFGIAALDAEGRMIGSTIGSSMEEKDLVPLFEKSFLRPIAAVQ